MKRLLKISRFLHKIIGLALCIFLMWTSLSGIFLNHPSLIASFSVPGWLVPSQYHPRHWNRSALKTVVFSTKHSGIVYVSGHMGIWRSEDDGRTFSSYVSGLPDSRYYRKTHSLVLVEGERDILWAGTNGGLFQRDPAAGIWQQVELKESHAIIKRILIVEDKLLVITDSDAFVSNSIHGDAPFERVVLNRPNTHQRVSWIRLLFDLHDGSIWGLPGKLLIDTVGAILFFLSFSGFYCWLFKKRLKRKKANRPKSKKTFRTLFAYHNKLGIWIAVFVLMSGATGMFMRPPLLALVADSDLPRAAYPGKFPKNPWHEKIHNAVYDQTTGNLLIDASDGVWQAPVDQCLGDNPASCHLFEKTFLPAPIFVMGATVFEDRPNGDLLVGSFAGLFRIPQGKLTAFDLIQGGEVVSTESSRPSVHMITSHFVTPGGESFIATHYGGLRPLDKSINIGRFPMPEELSKSYRMPLWNFLFELHNGRIFRDLIGEFYIFIVPLCAFLTVLLTVTGIFDWFKARRPKRTRLPAK